MGAHGRQRQVVHDGQVGEQVKVLKDHAHLLTNLIDIHALGGDVLAVKDNLTLGGFFQQVHTAQEGGFTRAGGADNDHFLPGLDMFVDVVEHLMVSKALIEMINDNHCCAASFPLCP